MVTDSLHRFRKILGRFIEEKNPSKIIVGIDSARVSCSICFMKQWMLWRYWTLAFIFTSCWADVSGLLQSGYWIRWSCSWSWTVLHVLMHINPTASKFLPQFFCRFVILTTKYYMSTMRHHWKIVPMWLSVHLVCREDPREAGRKFRLS